MRHSPEFPFASLPMYKLLQDVTFVTGMLVWFLLYLAALKVGQYIKMW